MLIVLTFPYTVSISRVDVVVVAKSVEFDLYVYVYRARNVPRLSARLPAI